MSNEREKYILALANLVNGSLLGYEDRSRVPEYEKTVDDYVDSLEEKNQKYKEVIDKAIEIISKELLCYDNESDEYIQGVKLLDILKEVE